MRVFILFLFCGLVSCGESSPDKSETQPQKIQPSQPAQKTHHNPKEDKPKPPNTLNLQEEQQNPVSRAEILETSQEEKKESSASPKAPNKEETSPLSLYSRDDVGNTLFHLACAQGDLKQIEIFLNQENVDLNVINTRGDTPLHTAVSEYRLKVVQALVDAGADINQQNAYGEAPIHLALISKMQDSSVISVRIEILDFLLRYGANPNIQTDFKTHTGSTPLHLAIPFQQLELIKVLIAHDASLNMQDKKGNTPLHKSVTLQALTLAQFLLKSGANKEIKNDQGETPMLLARKSSNQDFIDILSFKEIEIESNNHYNNDS